MLTKLLAAAAIFVATTAQAQDRWMSIPPAPEMPEATASGTVPTLAVQSAHDEAILMAHSEEMAAASRDIIQE